MKKLIAMATALLLSVGAYAQHEVGSVTIQPKIGMNIASMTDLDDADVRIGHGKPDRHQSFFCHLRGFLVRATCQQGGCHH